MAASKALRSSALHSLISRHLLHSSASAAAASKALLPSASTKSLNLFILKSGGIKSNAYLPLWRPLGSPMMAARTYATKEDRNSAVPDGGEGSDDDDNEFDEDDMDCYSGSDFDDEDDYEDPDEDPDAK